MADDDLTLKVAGQALSGWTGIRVTQGIERCPNDFEISLTEEYPGQVGRVQISKGDPCQVLLGSDIVITGFVNRYQAAVGPKEHSIQVTGRGSCQDLIDCSAEWPNGQISSNDVLGIAKKLALPYKIGVAAGAPTGASIPQFNLNFGETAWQVIERVCRYAALLAYELPDGSLFLNRVGTAQAASGLVEGQNIEHAAFVMADDQQYSEYRVVRQTTDVLGDLGSGSNIIAVAMDPTVKRHRVLYIVCENAPAQGNDIAQQRANWECARRAGRGLQVHVVTDSWRDSAGKLWAPNTLVPIEIPSLHIGKNTWLIGEVSFKREEGSGTTAELVIMPPQAFLPEPPPPLPFQDVTRQ